MKKVSWKHDDSLIRLLNGCLNFWKTTSKERTSLFRRERRAGGSGKGMGQWAWVGSVTEEVGDLSSVHSGGDGFYGREEVGRHGGPI